MNRKVKVLSSALTGTMMLGLLTGCQSSQQVDLTQGLVMNFEGYDGYGYVDIDKSDSRNALTKHVDYNADDYNQYAFWNCLDYEVVDEKDDYENGDKVTVRVTYNEDLAKKAKVKVSKDTKEFKVKGLKKVYREASDFKDDYIDDFKTAADTEFVDSLSYYDYDGHAVTEYKKLGTFVYYDEFKDLASDSHVYNVDSGIMNVYAFSFADFDDVYYDDPNAAYNPDTEEVDGFQIEYIASSEGKMPKVEESNIHYEQYASSEFFKGKKDKELVELFKKAYKEKEENHKLVSIDGKTTYKELENKKDKKKTRKKKTVKTKKQSTTTKTEESSPKKEETANTTTSNESNTTTDSSDAFVLDDLGGYRISFNGLFKYDQAPIGGGLVGKYIGSKCRDGLNVYMSSSSNNNVAAIGHTLSEVKAMEEYKDHYHSKFEFKGSEDKYCIIEKIYDPAESDDGLGMGQICVTYINKEYPNVSYSVWFMADYTQSVGDGVTKNYIDSDSIQALDNIFNEFSPSLFGGL